MSEEIETQELEETFEEEAEVETEESEVESNEEELAEAKQKIKDLEALIVKNKHKAKPVEKKETANSELSQKELYTLIKNNVHEEDVDEVVDYAKLKNIPIQDALKSPVIKAILKDKEEIRKTAEVSNTGNTRKGSTAKDTDTLVAKARKGELPQSDEDMKKIFNRIVGLDK